MYAKLNIMPRCKHETKVRSITLRPTFDPIIFGWNDTCGIRILRRQVAGEHASISRDKKGTVWLVNLDSEHYTILNGEEVKERRELKHNDHISIAGREFTFEFFSGQPLSLGKGRPLDHEDENIKTEQNSIVNPQKIEAPIEKKVVIINLEVQKKVNFGWSLWVVGSSSLLGDWGINSAKRMQWTEGDFWKITLGEEEEQLPNEIEYKYFIKHDKDEKGSFEEGTNRKMTVDKIEDNNYISPFFLLSITDDWNSKDQIKQLEPHERSYGEEALPKLTHESS